MSQTKDGLVRRPRESTAEAPKRRVGRPPRAAVTPSTPLKRQVLSTQVSAVIIRGLLDGRFQPKERLVEKDLAEMLGVSRSPIREALTELTQKGLLVREPGRGCCIRDWSKDDLTDLFGIRAVLEGYAAQLAAPRLDVSARKTFEKLIARMRTAGAKNDFLSMVDLDIKFHEALWDLAGSPLLRSVLDGLSEQFRLFHTMNWRFHGGITTVADNHMELLEGLFSGDPKTIENAMRQHVIVERMMPPEQMQ
jgi:DNA-binding GntR family transcriptional regulator